MRRSSGRVHRPSEASRMKAEPQSSPTTRESNSDEDLCVKRVEFTMTTRNSKYSEIIMSRTKDAYEKAAVANSFNKSAGYESGSNSDSESSASSDISASSAENKSLESSSKPLEQVSYDDVEKVLKRNLDNWRRSYEAYIKAWLPRVRKSVKDPEFGSTSENSSNSQRSSSEEKQSAPQQVESPLSGLNATARSGISKGTERIKITKISNDGKQSHFNQNVYITKFKDQGTVVPPHTYHVQMQSNILTENNRKLNYNPTEIECEDPEWSPDVYEEELTERYTHGVPWDREKPLEYVELSKQFRPAVVKSLRQLGCTVNDLLRYIIDPNPASDAKKAVRLQAQKEKAGPQSDWERWATVLSTLPESSVEAQLLAGYICKAFHELAGYSIWHLVKDMERRRPVKSEESPSSSQTYSSLMCRVCFTHLCTAHGEFEEDYQQASEKNGQMKYEPGNINYRLRVTGRGRRQRSSLSELELSQQVLPQRSYQYWRKNLDLYRDVDCRESLVNSHRGQFYPCSHQGDCDQAKCSCYEAGISCEKSCGCSSACQRRYTGCNCARAGRVCFQNSKCTCWQMERECDPDLCSKCGAAEALDPRNRAEDDAAAAKGCANVSIQRNIPKRMLLGRSQVSGFGLFAGEQVKKGEFLGEYKGEVLSEPEADRRQILHQHLREYLFVVNKDQQIDSTYAGNKIRFVNNSCRPKNINCYPIPLLCNGVIRMGLFAKRDVNAGEELFFNYGYSEQQLATFKEVVNAPTIASKTAKPAVANATEKKTVRRGTSNRQSMIVKSSTIPAPFKGNMGRVIDDSEESSYEEDEGEPLVLRRRPRPILGLDSGDSDEDYDEGKESGKRGLRGKKRKR